MTDLARKLGVRVAYESCRSFVGPLLAASLLLSGAAQAGAWEEFERRCLLPMENIEAVKFADLVQHEDVGIFALNGGADTFLLHDDNHLVVTSDEAGDVRGCGVIPAANQPKNEMAEFERAILAWWLSAKESGAYIEVVGRDSGRVLPKPALTAQSTSWREPRLQVSWGTYADIGRPLLFVEETDLES